MDLSFNKAQSWIMLHKDSSLLGCSASSTETEVYKTLSQRSSCLGNDQGPENGSNKTEVHIYIESSEIPWEYFSIWIISTSLKNNFWNLYFPQLSNSNNNHY